VEICKTFRFEAAHLLPHHPGKCSRLHGHSYRLEVYVAGTLVADGALAGMVDDFAHVGAVVEETVIDRLDHADLNGILENPTAELIALWIGRALAPRLPGLSKIVLWETQTACAIVTPADFA